MHTAVQNATYHVHQNPFNIFISFHDDKHLASGLKWIKKTTKYPEWNWLIMDIFTSDCCVPTGYLQMCMADTIVIFTSERRGKTTHTVLCIMRERKSCTSDIIYFLDFTVDFNVKAATLDNGFIRHWWNADSIYVMVLTCVGGWVGLGGRWGHSPPCFYMFHMWFCSNWTVLLLTSESDNSSDNCCPTACLRHVCLS